MPAVVEFVCEGVKKILRTSQGVAGMPAVAFSLIPFFFLTKQLSAALK